LNFLLAPKLFFNAWSRGREHKLWDPEAQIAQIEHKFLTPRLTSYVDLGGQHFSSPPKTDKLIASARGGHKFWDLEAQIAQIEHKFSVLYSTPHPTLGGRRNGPVFYCSKSSFDGTSRETFYFSFSHTIIFGLVFDIWRIFDNRKLFKTFMCERLWKSQLIDFQRVRFVSSVMRSTRHRISPTRAV